MENSNFDMDGFHDELKKSMEGVMESFQMEDPNSFKLNVRFRNESNNENPKYANDGDSGFDLRANLPEQGSYTLKPLERGLIPTGLYFELPYGYEMQIRPRSGLAFKHGISVLNSPGTVDAPYRGEIKVLLVNISDKEFTFEHGERIAQAVIQPVVTEGFINLQRTEEELSETLRGAGGFGSTGTK